MEYHNNLGEGIAFVFTTPIGSCKSIVANDTTARGFDDFVEIAAGRSFFRYEDLTKLCNLLEKIR